MDSTSAKTIWDIYTAAWSEPSPAKRTALFEQSLDPQCVYTDPTVQANGYGPLSDYMAQLRSNIPGIRFVTTDFSFHNEHILTHWQMLDGKSQMLAQGSSYGKYGANGRVTQMTIFFAEPLSQ
jgi:SnoaL-like domain